MSSQMGHVGSERDRTVYVMTKHALEGLTKAMAVELAPKGVRVVSIAPTFIETPLIRPFFDDPDIPQMGARPHPIRPARHGRGGRVRSRLPRLTRRRARQRIIAPRRRRLDRVVMRRRELILGIGGAVAAARAGGAQQKAMPVIGFLNPGPAVPGRSVFAAFREGLSETGYVEGQNVAIEYRGAENHYDRLPGLATDLVGRKVDVIVTNGALWRTGGERRNLDDPDRLQRRRRPGRGRPGRQSRPAGGQPHGL